MYRLFSLTLWKPLRTTTDIAVHTIYTVIEPLRTLACNFHMQVAEWMLVAQLCVCCVCGLTCYVQKQSRSRGAPDAAAQAVLC